ncbi:MAG TPA: 3-methyl-2-oxobutanoate dehydrogenase subunit VorB [Candidatus Nanoarchaeia archaeon]|nr:3-methyl-2-oxobutanoate dehydrogenase subunit VorB [Candidatus Nanoarchaeia archaeon]
MTKQLMKGNEALAEAALQAGCKFYAGYPITPQNEIPEYFAKRGPELGCQFIQSESEIAAINMIFGASAAGFRCMTSSSSPGISLKQEGISYIAGGELPCVIVNMVRGGPGLGNIRASQADYFQAVKGGGHGDYHMIVIAPSNVQEMYDLTMNAFDFADHYRNPVMILGDGIVGQMFEPVEIKSYKPVLKLPAKNFKLDGCAGREPRIVRTLLLAPADALAKHNEHLVQKYERIKKELCLHEEYMTSDAEIVIVAYGITARIAKGAIEKARKEGIKVGMIRPITVWPFPSEAIAKSGAKKFLAVEMSNGQLVEDVKLSLFGKPGVSVEHFGTGGGWYPSPSNIYDKIKEII